jgi:lipopolysaccharide biosynthesis protein
VVKRKAFFHDYSDFYWQSPARQGSKILSHIAETECYDAALIWDDLLRTQDVYTLMRSLHLRHTIPRDTCVSEKDAAAALRASVLALHIESDLVAELICKNLEGRQLPDRVDIHFADHDLREKYEASARAATAGSSRVSIRHAESGDGVSTWADAFLTSLETAEDDDLLCFISLEPPEDPCDLLLTSMSCHLEILESLLESPRSVSHIHELFARNQRLGLLLPYPPVHADMDPRGIAIEGATLDATRSALAGFRLHSRFEPSKRADYFIKPARCFWIRRRCLAAVDFEAMTTAAAGTPGQELVCQALLPALAQRNGYYTALVATDEQCAAYVDNLQYLYESSVGFGLGLSVLHARLDRLTTRLRQTGLRAFYHDVLDTPNVVWNIARNTIRRGLRLDSEPHDPEDED